MEEIRRNPAFPGKRRSHDEAHTGKNKHQNVPFKDQREDKKLLDGGEVGGGGGRLEVPGSKKTHK